MPSGVYIRTKNPLEYHKLNCLCSFCQRMRHEPLPKKIKRKISEEHKNNKKIIEQVTKLGKSNKGKKCEPLSKSHKLNCLCSFCKAMRGEHEHEKSPSWKGKNATKSGYYQRGQKIWAEKHGRIMALNRKIYLKEGMHFLLSMRPIHHEDFNQKNDTPWNLIKQESISEHRMKHYRHKKYQRFILDLNKLLEGLSEEEKNKICEKIILKKGV